MKPLFTVHLGARQQARIPSEEVVAEVSRRFDSFSLQPVEGWFRGQPDPGWSIQLASDLPEEVVDLATDLRRRFVQIGVGITVSGLYFRATLRTDLPELVAQLRAVLPVGASAGQPLEPGPWAVLRENTRDDLGGYQVWTDHLRCTAGEQFTWGQSDRDEEEIEAVDSGPSRYIAEYLRDNGYRAADLTRLVEERPEFLPLQEALDLLSH
jgi:hypothetical protein